MRIVQLIGGQTLYDPHSLGVFPESRERKGISQSTINLFGRAIECLLGKLMRLLCILSHIQAEPSKIGCNRCLVRGAFMKALENVVKLGCLILLAIKPAKLLKRLPPRRGIFRDAPPELFGFLFKFPLGGKTRQRQFTFWMLGRQLFRGMPERFELGAGICAAGS